ncbi:MAG: hypothetical protein KIT09_02150 [Bryobacteraceae bacterium]|nr:hypothetical protein [Bryobacteraceae bacterium]
MIPGVDLRATPTLQLSPEADEGQRAASIAVKVAEAVAAAEQEPLAKDLIDKHRDALKRIERLDAAIRFLRQHAGTLGERLRKLEAGYIERLIGDASNGKAPDTKALDEAIRVEHVRSLIEQATGRIAGQLRPQAEIDSLRAESMAHLARADALLAIANERADKLVARLKEAAADEITLPVDTKSGVIGAIFAEATRFEELAAQAVSRGRELEKKRG